MTEIQEGEQKHTRPLKAKAQNWHTVPSTLFHWIKQVTQPNPTPTEQGSIAAYTREPAEKRIYLAVGFQDHLSPPHTARWKCMAGSAPASEVTSLNSESGAVTVFYPSLRRGDIDPIIQWKEYQGHFVKRPRGIEDIDMVVSGKCNLLQEQ